MRWIIAFAKALPVVAITAVIVLIPIFNINNSKATGLAAVIGTAAEGLLCVGILNVAVGLTLWGLLVVWR